jgi:ankyrin repeat protein
MHHASRMGHTEVLELLIAKGGDVNARTATGHTPLHEASATSQLGGWPFPP